MGKYMRKRSVGRTPAVELGVRTRARSAAVANAAAAGAAAEAPAPKRPRKQATARAEAEAEAAVRGNGGGASPGCCYLQQRSRRLFMSAGDVQCPVPPLPAVAVQRSVPSGEPVVEVAGMCSSTASSVDVVLAMAPARETSGGEAEEAHEDCECDVESVVSDSAGCGRERRETTPSSRPPVDLSDEEWSQATDDDPKRHLGRTALATTGQRPRWLAEEQECHRQERSRSSSGPRRRRRPNASQPSTTSTSNAGCRSAPAGTNGPRWPAVDDDVRARRKAKSWSRKATVAQENEGLARAVGRKRRR